MPVSDDVRRWSDELARDPGCRAFLPLGEALRRQGQLDLALKVVLRGLERHSHDADAHDLLARVAADRGEVERARDEWGMALRLAPGHAGALKGLGFLSYADGRLEEAERWLAASVAADSSDTRAAGALALVRQALGATSTGAPTPANGNGVVHTPDAAAESGNMSATDARALFADLLAGGDHAALLLDATGLVLAGAYYVAEGEDVAQEVGAELSGVSDEARRAMRHLGLGEWSALVVETEAATVAMAPAPHDGLLMVAAPQGAPLGLVRRLLDRALERSRLWLEGGP